MADIMMISNVQNGWKFINEEKASKMDDVSKRDSNGTSRLDDGSKRDTNFLK